MRQTHEPWQTLAYLLNTLINNLEQEQSRVALALGSQALKQTEALAKKGG